MFFVDELFFLWTSAYPKYNVVLRHQGDFTGKANNMQWTSRLTIKDLLHHRCKDIKEEGGKAVKLVRVLRAPSNNQSIKIIFSKSSLLEEIGKAS